MLWNSYAAWYAILVSNDLQHCGLEPQINGLNASVRERCRQKYHCAMYVSDEASFRKCAHLDEEAAQQDADDIRSEYRPPLEKTQHPPKSLADFQARRKAHWEQLGVTQSQLWPAGHSEES